MERLTTIEQGCCIACFECKDKDDDCGCPEIDKCLHRLRDYENTGLTPEEIVDGKMLTGWVSVVEQLPIETGYYWITMRHLDGSLTTEKYYWEPEWPCEDAWNEVVVAWQPYYCPEPFVHQN